MMIWLRKVGQFLIRLFPWGYKGDRGYHPAGDIHSDGAVRIMENASVLGNIFAENDILLEKMQQCLATFLHRAILYLKKVPAQASRIRLLQLLPAEQ